VTNSTENLPSKDLLDSIETDEAGIFIPKTYKSAYAYAAQLLKSNALPKGFKNPGEIVVAMQFAKELGVPALMGIRNIAVINGQPSLWGELPLQLVRRSGALEMIDEYFVDSNYKRISLENKNLSAPKFAAICEIRRKGYDKATYTWDKDDVAKSNTGPVWKSYPSIMWMRKVRSLALKSQFADVLGSSPIAEYDHDVLVDKGEVEQGASSLQDRIDKAKEVEVEIQ